jgi:hypothetical protein
MYERDMKKWHVDRLQTALESMIQELDANRTQLRSRAELVENFFTNWRNGVLAAVLLAASVVLGLSSIGLLNEFMLQLVIIADIFVGLILFMVFTAIKGKVHGLCLSMDISFLSAISKLNLLRDYSTAQTYYLDKIEDKRINFLFDYGIFASAAVRAELIDDFEKMSDSVFFVKIQKSLRHNLDLTKANMNAAIAFYERSKSSWNDDYNRDLKKLRPVHEYFFKYHGYKIEKETGKIEIETDS